MYDTKSHFSLSKQCFAWSAACDDRIIWNLSFRWGLMVLPQSYFFMISAFMSAHFCCASILLHVYFWTSSWSGFLIIGWTTNMLLLASIIFPNIPIIRIANEVFRKKHLHKSWSIVSQCVRNPPLSGLIKSRRLTSSLSFLVLSDQLSRCETIIPSYCMTQYRVKH